MKHDYEHFNKLKTYRQVRDNQSIICKKYNNNRQFCTSNNFCDYYNNKCDNIFNTNKIKRKEDELIGLTVLQKKKQLLNEY